MQGSVGSTPLALEFCGQISHARGGVAESRHLAAVRLMRDGATDGRTDFVSPGGSDNQRYHFGGREKAARFGSGD